MSKIKRSDTAKVISRLIAKETWKREIARSSSRGWRDKFTSKTSRGTKEPRIRVHARRCECAVTTVSIGMHKTGRYVCVCVRALSVVTIVEIAVYVRDQG